MNEHNDPSSTVSRPPSVTAVILTTNEVEDAMKCIASLRQATYPALDIIVVDNASTDGGPERIAAVFPEVTVLRRATNEGYSAGNNTGIREALRKGSDYILISNADVVVEAGFLEPLVAVAENRVDVGLVIGTIRYTTHHDELYYAAGAISWWRCTGMNTTPRSAEAAVGTDDLDVDFVNGALFLVRRKVFEELGLFDEKFFLYYDDLEFSRRCLSRFTLVYTPKSVVYHKSGAGKGIRSYSKNYLYYSTRNRFWVFLDDSFLYRSYVFAYSVMNLAVKTAILLANVVTDPRRGKEQISALFRGFIDGLVTRPDA
jgi:GT2 family glycosyltransferase